MASSQLEGVRIGAEDTVRYETYLESFWDGEPVTVVVNVWVVERLVFGSAKCLTKKLAVVSGSGSDVRALTLGLVNVRMESAGALISVQVGESAGGVCCTKKNRSFSVVEQVEKGMEWKEEGEVARRKKISHMLARQEEH